jgi:isochorismate synthase
MKSFAAIYVPYIKRSLFFEESTDNVASMYIENFGATRKLVFKNNPSGTFPKFSFKDTKSTSISNRVYLDWVKECILQIQQGSFSKLVAAQYQVEGIDSKILDWNTLFQNLIDRLPNTFVYLFYLENELWLGASPELVGMVEDSVFTTISLAGTRKEEDFTAKEVEEQSIVSQFISSQFTEKNVNTEETTRILAFGSIQHLVNKYSYDVNDSFDFEKTIHVIHPSPALSGMPKEKSLDFILSNEPIQREFYSGLVSLTIDEKKYSFATIRCARFSANQIRYYAGAGITMDSDPQAEWEETLLKMEVLKKAIFSD